MVHDGEVDPHDIALELAKGWGLALGPQMPGSTCSNVYAVQGQDLVLKVPHMGSEERDAWWAAASFSKCGGIELVDCDEATGALLMPLAGQNLAESSLAEFERVTVCAELITSLHQAAPDERAIPLSSWFPEPADGASSLLMEAWDEAQRLLESSPTPVLLHGDLHHFNILSTTHGWRAIDPKGMCGDPAFEPTGYLRNPVGSLPVGDELLKLMKTRLTLFAEKLPYDPRRMWGWSFAQTAWCAQSGTIGDWNGAAEALWELRSHFCC